MNTILESISSGVKNWWWFIIKGLLLVTGGVVIFSRPAEGYIGLSLLFSVVILGSGFAQIFFASANTKVLKGWGWTLASGILDVVIGTYLLTFPVITMATMPFILGFWLFIRSFYLMGIAFDFKNLGQGGWGWLLLGGILVLVFGFIILYYPAAGVISIIYASGSAFIFAGICNFYLSAKLKNIKNTAKEIKENLRA